jgi:hypothetical protein
MKKILFAILLGLMNVPAFAFQFEDVSEFAGFPDYSLCNFARQTAFRNVTLRCSLTPGAPGFPQAYPRIINEYVLYARQVAPRLFECRYRMMYDCVRPMTDIQEFEVEELK